MAIAVTLIVTAVAAAQTSDTLLRSVSERDKSSRNVSTGRLDTLSAAEHLVRGQTYLDNRLFPQAREHFQKILDVYPTDPGLAAAIFGIGRSHMWERSYPIAITYLERVAREHPGTKEGREGLSFNGACHVRIGKNREAAVIYERYTVMYPEGERIDSAHLNIIDALREAGDYSAANDWVDTTRSKFLGGPTEVNALHARLRMEIHRGEWAKAGSAADLMLSSVKFGGSMTSADEVKFLKGFAFEKAGSNQQAISIYASIPNSLTSYFGGLASAQLAKMAAKFVPLTPLTAKQIADSPVVYRDEILANSRKHGIDPRFVLAIMKQESGFRPEVKSPSAARGLLQLVYDTALKYNARAGYPSIQPDDLYDPRINIAIGVEYIAALKSEFGGLNEAIAASYNGGEDNAARWLVRSNPKEAGIFASEVGFSETKNYVFKVMNNYRIYREIYDERLVRK